MAVSEHTIEIAALQSLCHPGVSEGEAAIAEQQDGACKQQALSPP
jgi:hypothetical protein